MCGAEPSQEVAELKPKRLVRFLAVSMLSALAVAATGIVGVVNAQGWRGSRTEPMAQSQPHNAPLLAVVALGEQRITIYDASGKTLQAPISTGQTGYETPAGVFSIVQKKEMHESNLYEDGKMPFMQRITWTGIALHAGALPGHPASHGCVRMPLQFAERLFPMTDLGLRVVIVPDDIAPGEISHPALPRSTAAADAGLPGSPKHLNALRSIAAAKAAEAEAADRRANEARRAAARQASEAAAATKFVRMAEGSLGKAQEQLQAAEKALEATASPSESQPPSGKPNDLDKKALQAKDRAEKARTRLADVEAQLATMKAQAQAKTDAASRAADEARTAEVANQAAADAAEVAKRKTQPVSVFISRRTQRYYVRQGFQPVHEGPVTIRDPDRPVGTYVFTALNYAGADLRWTVVSMYKDGASVQTAAVGGRPRGGSQQSAAPADVSGARAALDRIAIPAEAFERIPEIVLAGSSLIVSDEGPSIETGKDTDFVVVMSGEPQGALKVRKREPFGDDDDWFGGRSPFGAPYGSSNRGGYRGFWSYR